ncbi:hypothetical protein [Helicobacter labetoulli]|uniref:hypothetical protein n=1 Tax=Helicobacter labetoulli TaxID=2315333 RepID=UPI000EF6C5CE|nr:hypothetical protein [Helicobacter labetoulli]
MNETLSTDIFTQRLEEKSRILQQCQQSKSFTSCSQCESFLLCQTRQEYVKAVYESMSKGQQGDFDFN